MFWNLWHLSQPPGDPWILNRILNQLPESSNRQTCTAAHFSWGSVVGDLLPLGCLCGTQSSSEVSQTPLLSHRAAVSTFCHVPIFELHVYFWKQPLSVCMEMLAVGLWSCCGCPNGSSGSYTHTSWSPLSHFDQLCLSTSLFRHLFQIWRSGPHISCS